jgi:hypothetical protein
MSFSIYDASAPLFVASLTDMKAWLDKAAAETDEATVLATRLAPDMHPLPRQVQFASDAAKGAMARLAGIEVPSMADTETSFAELKQRCDRTIAFVESVGRDALADAAAREVVLKFPSGAGYRFSGAEFLTRFALPNFFFHVTTTYAILRHAGVSVGKIDYLQHIGPPNL